jgi:hypothetical protein
MDDLTVPEILAMREEGKLFAELEGKKYVLMLYEAYPNGTTGDSPVEDADVAAKVGEVTGLGPPTDPNGWGIWEIGGPPDG